MKTDRHQLYINGKWQEGHESLNILSPYNHFTVAECDQASQIQIEEMLQASTNAFEKFKLISRHTRFKLLSNISNGIAKRRQEFAESIMLEAGKPIQLADAEVGRAIVTFLHAAEEAKRWCGEMLPIDIEPSGRAYSPSTIQWFPRGPILAIAPFNFPLNLIAHKVAPALASGCTVMVKPPPQAPGAAKLLAEVFEEAAKLSSDSQEIIPLATLQVFSCSNELASHTVLDNRVATVSFTGSERVGWIIQEKAIRKKVILELGGNAGVIVNKDADLLRAANRCAFGGFAYSGQVCISVQRVFVHKEISSQFTELFINEVQKIKTGDPNSKDTLVGPLINSAAADRIMIWIDEALRSGAKILIGGKRENNIIQPTVLTNVPYDQKINCEEVFGPIVILETIESFEDGLCKINDSKFGLQAGIFTNDQRLIRNAFETLNVGGLLINEVPTFRSDNMPYGGVKDSGLGREGVKYAMEQYSERKAMISWFGGNQIN